MELSSVQPNCCSLKHKAALQHLLTASPVEKSCHPSTLLVLSRPPNFSHEHGFWRVDFPSPAQPLTLRHEETTAPALGAGSLLTSNCVTSTLQRVTLHHSSGKRHPTSNREVVNPPSKANSTCGLQHPHISAHLRKYGGIKSAKCFWNWPANRQTLLALPRLAAAALSFVGHHTPADPHQERNNGKGSLHFQATVAHQTPGPALRPPQRCP